MKRNFGKEKIRRKCAKHGFVKVEKGSLRCPKKGCREFPKFHCDTCNDLVHGAHTHCPKCGSPPKHHEVRIFDVVCRWGDIHCVLCGEYVRMYDPG